MGNRISNRESEVICSASCCLRPQLPSDSCVPTSLLIRNEVDLNGVSLNQQFISTHIYKRKAEVVRWDLEAIKFARYL